MTEEEYGLEPIPDRPRRTKEEEERAHAIFLRHREFPRGKPGLEDTVESLREDIASLCSTCVHLANVVRWHQEAQEITSRNVLKITRSDPRPRIKPDTGE